jgi:hypothetical protein
VLFAEMQAMNARLLSVMARLISIFQSWPGHSFSMSRHTLIPALSRASCN